MADKKISALSSGTALDGTETAVIVQGGATVKTFYSAIKTFVLNGLQLAWGSITGTPTTLAGYGITDAASSSALSGEAIARASADTANNTAISNHTAATTSVHGIADTSKLQTYGRVTFSNADATISAGTHYLAQIGTLSAARTVTLPAASAVPAGFELIVEDASRTVSVLNTITITRLGSDTVNGGTSTALNYPGQRTTLISDGTSAWTTAQAAKLAHLIMTIQDVGNLTWTSQGAALDDLRGNSSNARWNTDLTGFSDVQVACNIITAGATGAELRAQYSTDNGSTWNYFGTNTPAVVIDTTGQKASSWIAIPAAAQGVCWVRIVGIGGNGSTSPVFGWACIRGR